ncbi:phage protein D [Thalassospira sp. MBR-102]|jgi:phage protein D|uniref:contractile injection system protein, VgrG/Pvc8 family n=1 Tax=Thalassospira sp. MBR-102 TaxID=3156466 RepID=UPI003393DF5E
MIPAYQILADDTDVTVSMARYLTMLRIVDKRGVEADECEIELVDPDGTLNLPRRGVRLQIMMGWENSLQDKGSFIVDQVSESGPPDRITITGCSADFQGAFKVQREESYSGKTIGQILTTIAKRHNLIPAIEEQLAGILIDHIDQTNESDPNFLTRLGTDYDAIATVKAGRLLFMPVGHTKTVSGLSMPSVTINRDDTVSHRFQIADREGSYTGVRAKWRDHKANTTKFSMAGTGEQWKTLKRDYPTAVAAFHAARAEWARMQRGQKTISLDLAVGNPSIHAGQPLRLAGWRDEISGTSWVTGEVTHALTESGITASFDAEEQI